MKMNKCDICDREFKTLGTLRRHLTIDHDIPYDEHRNHIIELAKREDMKSKYEQSLKVDYDRLLHLTKDVPYGLDFNKVRQRISPEMKMKIRERDNNICYVCNAMNSPHIHHRVPNGKADEDNLFTLCYHCHDIVHALLFVDKKWKHRFTPG